MSAQIEFTPSHDKHSEAQAQNLYAGLLALNTLLEITKNSDAYDADMVVNNSRVLSICNKMQVLLELPPEHTYKSNAQKNILSVEKYLIKSRFKGLIRSLKQCVVKSNEDQR